MKFKYMGTGAAEAIPAIFCQCELCTKARKNKGKDIRGRSGAVIDGRLMIDFPPDSYMLSILHDIDLSRITDIIITHSHSDHFDGAELMMRMPKCYCYITEGSQSINLYANKTVGKRLEECGKLEFGDKDINFIKYHKFKKFNPKKISNYTVIPLPAEHMSTEKAFNYIIKDGSKKILYAHDTGYFKQETFEFLKQKQIQFDFISFDCTHGVQKCPKGHMGLLNVIEVREQLKQQGNLKPDTILALSHFSHNAGLLHDELVKEAEKYGFIVAYDGMEIEI